jgi:quinol monooxygenase YgiN
VEKIQASATFPTIAADNVSEFKQVAAEALDAARDEPGTLQYDWFFSDDETKCVVRETYENSDAVLAHIAHVGDLVGQLAQLGGGLEIEAFGTMSPELAEAVVAFQPTVDSFFQGK